eukprot:g46236.t1
MQSGAANTATKQSTKRRSTEVEGGLQNRRRRSSLALSPPSPSPRSTLSSPVFFRCMPNPDKITCGTWDDVHAVWKRDGVVTLAAEGDTGMLLKRVARERELLMYEVLEELEPQAIPRKAVPNQDTDRWISQVQENVALLSVLVSEMLKDLKTKADDSLMNPSRVLGGIHGINGGVITAKTFDTGEDNDSKIKDLIALKCLMDARSKQNPWSVRYAQTQDAFINVLTPFTKLLGTNLRVKTESFLSSPRDSPKQIPHFEGTVNDVACIMHFDALSLATEYLTRSELELAKHVRK